MRGPLGEMMRRRSIGKVGALPRARFLPFVIAALVAGYVMQDAVVSRYLGTCWSESFTGASDYRGIAERWIETGMLENSRPPAYPLFLGLNLAIWGQAFYVTSVVTLQAVASWGTLVVLFLIARRVTGSGAWGLIAVGMVALNAFWVVEVLNQRETFLYSAILTALAGAVVYIPSSSKPACAAAGTLCALGWLTRPTGIVLLPIVLVILWRSRRGRAGLAREALVLILAFVLPLLAWTGYQQVEHGSIAVSGTNNSVNLLKGNHSALVEIYPFIEVDRLDPALELIRMDASARGADPRREQYRHALRFVLGSPFEAIALLPRKLAAFFVPIEFPLGRGTVRETADGNWQLEDYVPNTVSGLGITALPGVIAFFGALRWWRTLAPSALFIVLAVGATACIHLVTFAETRFRLPYDPLMALLFVQMAATRLRRQATHATTVRAS